MAIFGKDPQKAQEEAEARAIRQSSDDGVLAESHKSQVYERLGQDQTPFAEFVLGDSSIPTEILKIFPVWGDKELALTNITDPDQMYQFKCLFESNVNLWRILTPAYKRTMQQELGIVQLRAKVNVKLLRSTGGAFRERGLFHTVVSALERPVQQERRGGILSRIGKAVV